jgi:3-oxoacyl-[acyl-carrier protein] reductase
MISHSKILVCGASGGIGFELVKLIQFDNVKIVGAYNNTAPKFIPAPEIELESVDFSDLDKSKQFFFKHKDSTGLVLAAGLANPQLIGSITNENITNEININLASNIIALNEILPTMVTNGFGRIILLGSVVARDGGVGLLTYSSTKSALLGLVRTANREIRHMKKKINSEADVTINILSPGYVDTGMTRNMPLRIVNKIKENSNSSKFIDPCEVALTLKWMLNGIPSISNSNIEINDGINLC